jgi:hypothetical protein
MKNSAITIATTVRPTASPIPAIPRADSRNSIYGIWNRLRITRP